MNGYTSQLKGPFKANQELFTLIQKNAIKEIEFIIHLGVQTDVKNFIIVDNQEIEIGKTGIYELNNTKINSLYFEQDTDENTLIDYTIKLIEEE